MQRLLEFESCRNTNNYNPNKLRFSTDHKLFNRISITPNPRP